MPRTRHAALLLAVLGAQLVACAERGAAPAPTLRQRLDAIAVDWDDPRVARAVAELRAQPGDLVALQALARPTLARHGAAAMQVALALEDDLAGLEQEIARLAPARCASAGAAPALVLCYRALVDIDGSPGQLSPEQGLQVRGRVLGDTTVTEVLHMTPDGEIRALELERDGRRFFAAAAAPLLPGRHSVEVMVRTPRGVEVAALWERWVAGSGSAPAPPEPAIDRHDPADGDAAQAAQRFFAALRQDRAAAGLPPLTWSPTLARTAAQRAASVAEDGMLIHVGEALLERQVDDVGQPLSWLGENIARARSVAGARHAIMESPSHRRNHLAAEAELGAVGAVWRGQGAARTLYLVELLARSYAGVDAGALAADALQRIQGWRRARGAGPLAVDADLATRAQRLAREMLAAGQLLPAPARGSLSAELLELRPDLVRVGAALSRVDSSSALAPTASLLAPHYNRIGVGAARADRRSPWFVVVLVAQARPPAPVDDEGAGFGGDSSGFGRH